MSEHSRRQQRLEDSLEDIIDNIARIERYVAGLNTDDLSGDELRHDAVERCLERICEAAVRLSDAAAELMPNQPWQDIRGMGNRLRHAYEPCRSRHRVAGRQQSSAGTEGRRHGQRFASCKAMVAIEAGCAVDGPRSAS